MKPLESLEGAKQKLRLCPQAFFKHHYPEFAARCHSKDGTKDIAFPLKPVFLGRLRTTALRLRPGG